MLRIEPILFATEVEGRKHKETASKTESFSFYPRKAETELTASVLKNVCFGSSVFWIQCVLDLPKETEK